MILFGHSHRPLVTRQGGRIVANPGSPTDKRINPRYSYAHPDRRRRAGEHAPAVLSVADLTAAALTGP